MCVSSGRPQFSSTEGPASCHNFEVTVMEPEIGFQVLRFKDEWLKIILKKNKQIIL